MTIKCMQRDRITWLWMVRETRDSDEFAGGTEGMDVAGGTGREGMLASVTSSRAIVRGSALLSNTFTLPDTCWRAGKTSSDYFFYYFLLPYVHDSGRWVWLLRVIKGRPIYVCYWVCLVYSRLQIITYLNCEGKRRKEILLVAENSKYFEPTLC